MTQNNNLELDSQIKRALALQQNGEVKASQALFSEILSHHPNNADALHGLGLCYALQRDFKQAVSAFEKAVKAAPHVAEFHNNLGNAYKAIGQIEAALTHYQEALRLKPTYPQAHNNLGTLYYQLGNYEKASEHFEKSIRMGPLSVDSHYNLANCYIQLDRLLDAVPHYQEVLKLRPDHLGALHNLGITLCGLKRFAEARPLLVQVIQREPENIDALFYLGIVERSLFSALEAKSYYEKILKLDPNHASSHHNLATLSLELGEKENARTHFEEALRLQPENKTAMHMLRALQGIPSNEGAPFEYTRALFDQYAYTYDEHVKNKLQYHVPFLLRQAMTPFVSKEDNPWTVLDLGCGTGLCAPLFADIADKLIGVDLSPNMIQVAKQQGGYYKLHVMDIATYLKHHQTEFELIIAADVFVYFGALEEIFALVFKALKPSAFFTFSIERLEDAEATAHPEQSIFQLRDTGRYAHHLEYIHELCQQIGFTIQVEKPEVLRYQEDRPVLGNIFVLQKN
jgi:predicted TPR repeat methyltransferase